MIVYRVYPSSLNMYARPLFGTFEEALEFVVLQQSIDQSGFPGCPAGYGIERMTTSKGAKEKA